MNQNLHVRLRGPLGHLTLKAVMMINRGINNYTLQGHQYETSQNRLICRRKIHLKVDPCNVTLVNNSTAPT